jgi:hypothetical protein
MVYQFLRVSVHRPPSSIAPNISASQINHRRPLNLSAWPSRSCETHLGADLFQLSWEIDPLHPVHLVRTYDPVVQALQPRLEFAHVHEQVGLDGQQEMTDVGRLGRIVRPRHFSLFLFRQMNFSSVSVVYGGQVREGRERLAANAEPDKTPEKTSIMIASALPLGPPMGNITPSSAAAGSSVCRPYRIPTRSKSINIEMTTTHRTQITSSQRTDLLIQSPIRRNLLPPSERFINLAPSCDGRCHVQTKMP